MLANVYLVSVVQNRQQQLKVYALPAGRTEVYIACCRVARVSACRYSLSHHTAKRLSLCTKKLCRVGVLYCVRVPWKIKYSIFVNVRACRRIRISNWCSLLLCVFVCVCVNVVCVCVVIPLMVYCLWNVKCSRLVDTRHVRLIRISNFLWFLLPGTWEPFLHQLNLTNILKIYKTVYWHNDVNSCTKFSQIRKKVFWTPGNKKPGRIYKNRITLHHLSFNTHTHTRTYSHVLYLRLLLQRRYTVDLYRHIGWKRVQIHARNELCQSRH